LDRHTKNTMALEGVFRLAYLRRHRCDGSLSGARSRWFVCVCCKADCARPFASLWSAQALMLLTAFACAACSTPSCSTSNSHALTDGDGFLQAVQRL
jgi:hypothetical protein